MIQNELTSEIQRTCHLHESEDDDWDVMSIETFVYSVDIVFSVCRHVPLDAFQMTIYGQTLCHNDGTGKNVVRSGTVLEPKKVN